ncbi:MAG: N-acetyltransferase protein [Candidatus Dependentiae bacterium]|nr:N-acetyltransferase protein [Candidatus Dependentiae bacterium]
MLQDSITHPHREEDEEAFERKMQGIRAEILLFGATFKAAKETGKNLNLEDIRGTEVNLVESSLLNDENNEDKEKMISLYSAAREGFSEEHFALRLQGFKDLLASKEGRFYILKHNQEIVAFVHFKDLPNGNVYGGSFSVMSDVKGERLGDALLRTALDTENAHKDVEAVVDSGDEKLLRYYRDTLGHQLTGETVMVGSTKYLKMIRTARLSMQTPKSPRLAA